MFSIDLKWQDFQVNMEAVEAWMKANAGPSYCGNSADVDLTLWFTADPGDSVKAAVKAYWEGLDESSSEAKSYQTKAQKDAAAAAAKASAMASASSKLKALGLSDAEISAMLGQ